MVIIALPLNSITSNQRCYSIHAEQMTAASLGSPYGVKGRAKSRKRDEVGKWQGRTFKGARTFLRHSVAGLGTHLNDKEGMTEIRRGGTGVKC